MRDITFQAVAAVFPELLLLEGIAQYATRLMSLYQPSDLERKALQYLAIQIRSLIGVAPKMAETLKGRHMIQQQNEFLISALNKFAPADQLNALGF